jgi:hypothetical protein
MKQPALNLYKDHLHSFVACLSGVEAAAIMGCLGSQSPSSSLLLPCNQAAI